MPRKFELSDGRVIEGGQLGKLKNGVLADFSPLKRGGSVKTLASDGRWIDAGDISGQGAFAPLRDSELETLIKKGVLRRV